MTTAEQISQECDAIKAMLLAKNARYGDSAMQPRRIFSRADHLEQLKVRIDDKLSRIATMGPDSEDEDTTGDLIGYLVLLRIARRRARQGAVVDDTFEPWEAAIPEQDAQRREQVAHGAGYIIPQMDDGDDDPAAVHIVLDLSSRNATLTPDTLLPLDDDQEELSVEDQERIYRVPGRRTSLATMPDESLGALCGRVGR